jgi:N-acetyl-anhydromuramyl-L-alanine amidase AmpD/peptidoglycan/xylan/chitin deacetylase (PgdA/CDA1 family)
MPKSHTISQKLLYALVLLAMLAGCTSPTETEIPSSLPEASSTPIATATPIPTSTSTPIPTPTATLTPTVTLSPTFTNTPVPATRIPIIEYHDPDYHVGDQVEMTPQLFSDQISWLADNGYRTLSAEEMVSYLDGKATYPQKSVVLTFDIGLPKRPVYHDVVIPLLQKFGFKAIFFILSNSGVEQDECKDGNIFCWNDFRTWAQEGVISIGSHGLYHPDFKTLTSAGMTQEMTKSRQILIDKTGQTPLAFAFPYDSVPAAGPNLAKAAGYQFAVAGITGRKDGVVALVNDPERFSLPRVYPYSAAYNYPKLNGYNQPFGDVITKLIQPNAAAASPTPAGPSKTGTATPTAPGGATPTQPVSDPSSTPSAAADNVNQVLNICQDLPSSTFFRTQILMNASFTPDVSASTQAQLPGFKTSPSCNFDGRDVPEAIVIHYTVGSLTASMAEFYGKGGDSAHYIIDRDGKVVQMVPEGLAAYHVGCSGKRSVCKPGCPICDGPDGALTEPYTRSIGIELVNLGRYIPQPTLSTDPNTYYYDSQKPFGYLYWDEYPAAQIASLVVLVEDIAARWNIPIDPEHVLGHYSINDKVDPGPALNLFWWRDGSPPRAPVFSMVEP